MMTVTEACIEMHPHFLQQHPKLKVPGAFGGSFRQFLSKLSSWWKTEREERWLFALLMP